LPGRVIEKTVEQNIVAGLLVARDQIVKGRCHSMNTTVPARR
jgi:hypothetical protein